MSRLFLKVIFFGFFAFSIISLVAQLLGSTQPANTTLRGFTDACEDKPQPCWYGIVPGLTTAEEGQQILNTIGYEIFQRPGFASDNVTWYQSISLPCSEASVISAIHVNPNLPNVSLIDNLSLFKCQSVYLGDIVTTLGKPDQFYFWGWSFFHDQLLTDVVFDYGAKGNRCLSFMPKVEVSAFSIRFVKGASERPIDTKYPWHGFLPYQQYVSKYGFMDCYTLAQAP